MRIEILVARFGLRVVPHGPIANGMKIPAVTLISCIVLMAGCQKKGEITVTEKRELTSKDVKPKLFATSDQRFKNAQPSPVEGTPPPHWLVLPASQFRLLNYRFGESGLGEVSVGLSAGTVKANADRWLRQFQLPPLEDEAFAKLRTVPLAGVQGVWLDASGDYESGMGASGKPGYGLAGIIASVNGQILTVKMLGPKAEVEAERGELEKYAQTLRLTHAATPAPAPQP